MNTPKDLFLFEGQDYSGVLSIGAENESAILVTASSTTGNISIAMTLLATYRERPVVIVLDHQPWVVMPGDPPRQLRDRWYKHCATKINKRYEQTGG